VQRAHLLSRDLLDLDMDGVGGAMVYLEIVAGAEEAAER